MLDDPHLWAAASRRAGIERNPVRAGLVTRAEDWPSSSAAAHCRRREDPLLSPIQMPWPVPDWSAYLRDEDEAETTAIRRQTCTGRPWGGDGFIKSLESSLGRILHPRKRGPKPKPKRKKPTNKKREQ